MKFVFIYDYLNESSIEPTIRMVQKKTFASFKIKVVLNPT